MKKKAKILHLAGVVTGKWLVRTEHSEYVLDLDAMTATRIAGKKANRWHDEDVTYILRSVPVVEVGMPMTVLVYHGDGVVYSTRVKRIDPIHFDEAA